MYQEFYGFSEEPFDLQPNPRFLYLARGHYEALSAMMSGIKERKGLITVTGEAGIGKTFLLYALLKDLSEKIRTAFVFNPQSDFPHLLKRILQDLGVAFGREKEDTDRLVLQFKKYLHERLPGDETVAIVLDEAQNLDGKTLEDLGRLFILDTPATKLLQLILVGHPDLEVKLNSKRLRPLKKKIAVRCRIRPLSRNEGRGYLKYRLKLAGRDLSEVFTSEAANRVWEFAGGIPRVMNLLCSRALDFGYHHSSPVIDSKIVQEAMQDLAYLQSGKSRAHRSAFFRGKTRSQAAPILFFLFSISVFILSLGLLLFLFLRK
jgi:general secretion pathway protein A